MKGDEIGKAMANGLKATNATDLRFDTWGFGAAWRMDANTRISAYFDLVKNETSKNLNLYTVDQHDNVFHASCTDTILTFDNRDTTISR